MLNRLPLTVLAALLLVVGCNATPLQRAEAIERSYDAGLTGIRAAIDAGLVKTPAQARVVKAAVDEANRDVADYTAHAQAQDQTEKAYVEQKAVDAVARLATVYASLKGTK